jgi:hypothetical protein
MKRLPRKLVIEGKTFTVRTVREVPGGNWAWIDREQQTISILARLPLDCQWETLFHEMMHAVLTHHDELDHALHIRLSERLFGVLVQNKLFPPGNKQGG